MLKKIFVLLSLLYAALAFAAVEVNTGTAADLDSSVRRILHRLLAFLISASKVPAWRAASTSSQSRPVSLALP